MAYENNNFGERTMHKGNWTCADCGASITELPFKPNPERENELKCRDCHRKSAPKRSGGRGGSFGGPREMFKGDWECSKCNTAITELPFKPNPERTDNLMCRDCFKASRA